MYHSDSGFMDGFTVFVYNPAVVEIMNDFIEYLWENFTLDGDEVRNFLNDMLY